jgi:hypothetical protein
MNVALDEGPMLLPPIMLASGQVGGSCLRPGLSVMTTSRTETARVARRARHRHAPQLDGDAGGGLAATRRSDEVVGDQTGHRCLELDAVGPVAR